MQNQNGVHRFYVPTLPPPAQTVILPPPLARQCARVLRLEPGERVALFEDTGREAVVLLTTVTAEHTAGQVETVAMPRRDPRHRLELFMALPRQEKWEWVLQKATEIGVSQFQPVESARCVARLTDRDQTKKMERWTKIVVEAAEQSGRTSVPGLNWIVPVEHLPPGGPGDIVLHTRTGSPGLRSVLETTGLPLESAEVRLLIGPEGGLDDGEAYSAVKRGWRIASLGPRTLRCETAAITACVIALDFLGELGSC